VGVSAGTVDEDHRVAEAGRKAFTTERPGPSAGGA
jgi:uncharacterized protein GlcG (DUF336 family)